MDMVKKGLFGIGPSLLSGGKPQLPGLLGLGVNSLIGDDKKKKPAVSTTRPSGSSLLAGAAPSTMAIRNYR